MTAAFWWYVLAGFLIGFCVSTAWEWLYFRKRRMRITDRRIAELQQTLRTQARAVTAVEVLPQPGVTWSANEYQSPGVFMENEAGNALTDAATAAVTAGAVGVVASARDGHANGNGTIANDGATIPPWATQAAETAPVPVQSGIGAGAAPTKAEEPGSSPDSGVPAAVAAAAIAAGAALAENPAAERDLVPDKEGRDAGEPPAPDEVEPDAVAAAAAAKVARVGAPEDDLPAGIPKPEGGDEWAQAAVVATAVTGALLSHDNDAPAAPQAIAAPPDDVAQAAADETPPAVFEATAGAASEPRPVPAQPGLRGSEPPPGGYAALPVTQRVRNAARQAWRKTRNVAEFLRSS